MPHFCSPMPLLAVVAVLRLAGGVAWGLGPDCCAPVAGESGAVVCCSASSSATTPNHCPMSGGPCRCIGHPDDPEQQLPDTVPPRTADERAAVAAWALLAPVTESVVPSLDDGGVARTSASTDAARPPSGSLRRALLGIRRI